MKRRRFPIEEPAPLLRRHDVVALYMSRNWIGRVSIISFTTSCQE
jgi:hypothetical protein